MASLNNINTESFFSLLRAGLWENTDLLSSYEGAEWGAVYKLAREQTVLGLVAAGVGYAKSKGFKISEEEMGQLMGDVVYLELMNSEMNSFIADIVGKMRKEGIYSLIVKGQGIGQCYEKPMWRGVGDVDFFLDAENYEKAKRFFSSVSTHCETEGLYSKHFSCHVGNWVVELHGTLHCGLSRRIDKELDEIQADTFENKRIRVWNNGGCEVYLPCVDNDVLFVFTHILKHFYIGGVGLRQLCDWCRMLWKYRSEIDAQLLEQRLSRMGLLGVWRAFGTFAVVYLGMPVEAMPLYRESAKLKRKAKKIYSFVVEVGNFGKNRDLSYYSSRPYVVRKAISMKWRIGDAFRHTGIFPWESLRYLPRILFNGLRSAVRGEG